MLAAFARRLGLLELLLGHDANAIVLAELHCDTLFGVSSSKVISRPVSMTANAFEMSQRGPCGTTKP